MAERRCFPGDHYNQPRQRYPSHDSNSSHHSYHEEQQQPYYHNMQPGSNDPLQNEMGNLHLAHSHHGSNSSFDVQLDESHMNEFAYTQQQPTLTGEPNIMWSSPGNIDQNAVFPSDVGYPHYGVANQFPQQPIPAWDYNQTSHSNDQVNWNHQDDGLESTLTYANNNPAPNQVVPVSSQYSAHLISQSNDFDVPRADFGSTTSLNDGNDANYESDTSVHSAKRTRSSRSAKRPYDRPPPSRSTSRTSEYSQGSSNQSQAAGRGRPALYNIDLNNLTEAQKKCKEKIEASPAFINKSTEEKKAYLMERLQNNEAVKNSRNNKSLIMRDVLEFGERLYIAAKDVCEPELRHIGESKMKDLLVEIEQWEIENEIKYQDKVNQLKPKIKEDP